MSWRGGGDDNRDDVEEEEELDEAVSYPAIQGSSAISLTN